MQGCSQGGRGGLLKPPFWSTEDFVHHLAIQWPVHHIIGYYRYTGNADDDIHYRMHCHKENQSSPPQCKWQTK